MKILLSQAQAQGLELAVDTNSLENEFLLKQAGREEEEGGPAGWGATRGATEAQYPAVPWVRGYARVPWAS